MHTKIELKSTSFADGVIEKSNSKTIKYNNYLNSYVGGILYPFVALMTLLVKQADGTAETLMERDESGPDVTLLPFASHIKT